jgi:hypothetical protein
MDKCTGYTSAGILNRIVSGVSELAHIVEVEQRIDRLINEIGTFVAGCTRSECEDFDRQLDAFRERARQAQQLAQQARIVSLAGSRVLDGYLHRAVLSLEVSRDYFADRSGNNAPPASSPPLAQATA